MSPSLWQSIPDGLDLERFCLKRPEAHRIPLNWSRRDWQDEFNCICLGIVCTAFREFDGQRGPAWIDFARWKLRNSLCDHHRLLLHSHQYKFVPTESLEDLIDQGSNGEEHRKETRLKLARTLWALGKCDRQILLLLMRDGCTEREVAERLGKSRSWVSRKLGAIRTKLTCLKKRC